MQQGLDDPKYGARNNPLAEANIAKLLAHWREGKFPIVHIRHCSTEPGSPLQPGLAGNAFKPEAEPLPGETEIQKTVNCAFIDTDLDSQLHRMNVRSLVIVGLTTDHCVSTTARVASNMGFDVTVVEDATATHERIDNAGIHYTAEQIHNINLASLNNEFASIVSTQTILQDVN